MKNRTQTSIVWLLVTLLLVVSCTKETNQVDQKANSTSIDGITKGGGLIYFSYFTPWMPRTVVTKVDYEFAIAANANAAQDVIESFFHTPHTKTGAIFSKYTGTTTNSKVVIDMEDPCDPTGPPPDEIKATVNGTSIVSKGGKTHVIIADCGSSGNGTTTFVVTFTFYSDNFSPDYTGYIIITEDAYHDITDVTFKVEPSGIGIYGDMQTVDAPVRVAPNSVTGGNDVVFDFHGIQETSMGLGKLYAWARLKFEINGILHLDSRNNPTGGTVYMKPY